MPFVVKVYFEKQAGETDIRRFRVVGDVAPTYDYIHNKVAELFPELAKGQFNLYWKDSDDDIISCSTDDEMKEAFSGNKESVLKLFVSVIEDPKAGGEETDVTSDPRFDMTSDPRLEGWRWGRGGRGMWGMRGMPHGRGRGGFHPMHHPGMPMCGMPPYGFHPGCCPGWMKKKWMKKKWMKKMWKKHGAQWSCSEEDTSPCGECEGQGPKCEDQRPEDEDVILVNQEEKPVEGTAADNENIDASDKGDKRDGKCKKHKKGHRHDWHHHKHHGHHGHHGHHRRHRRGRKDDSSSDSSDSSDEDMPSGFGRHPGMFWGPMNSWNMMGGWSRPYGHWGRHGFWRKGQTMGAFEQDMEGPCDGDQGRRCGRQCPRRRCQEKEGKENQTADVSKSKTDDQVEKMQQ